jgi:hypothetical protein
MNSFLYPSKRVVADDTILDLVPTMDRQKFPGTMPKGLRCVSLHYIADSQHRARYIATAKLDGVRVLAIVCREGVFLVDRSLSVFKTDCPPLDLRNGHCVFDGELMDNQYFLAFDAMVVDGVQVCSQPFVDRYTKLCTFLETTVVPGPLQIVPKRMHSMDDLVTLFTFLGPHRDPHVFSINMMDAVHEKWAPSVPPDSIYQADGAIFMDGTDSFLVSRSFGLVKWKKTVTFDVLMDMKDLCSKQGEPRRTDTVQTYYWEYSERMHKSVRVPFMRCRISASQRRALWLERMRVQKSGIVCVECFRDREGRWSVLRCRPEKNRSNSSRTINDTLRIDEEGITISHIQKAFGQSTSIEVTSTSSLHTLCNTYGWLGYVWAQATDICELELRLLHNGTSSISASMFHRIVERLRMNTSMEKSEISSTDYTSGSIRATSIGDTSYAIQKEPGFKTTFLLPDTPLISMHCVLSYEHPSASWDMNYVTSQCTTRRQKRRWRFVHRETVAIDCTHVQTMDWRDPETITDSYEIEIELLRNVRYNNIPYKECSGLILSMIWRMLLYVLGVSVETTNIIECTN